jgi:hypothetical protein
MKCHAGHGYTIRNDAGRIKSSNYPAVFVVSLFFGFAPAFAGMEKRGLSTRAWTRTLENAQVAAVSALAVGSFVERA